MDIRSEELSIQPVKPEGKRQPVNILPADERHTLTLVQPDFRGAQVNLSHVSVYLHVINRIRSRKLVVKQPPERQRRTHFDLFQQFPAHRFVVVPFVIAALYVFAIVVLESRWRAARAGSAGSKAVAV